MVGDKSVHQYFSFKKLSKSVGLNAWTDPGLIIKKAETKMVWTWCQITGRHFFLFPCTLRSLFTHDFGKPNFDY